MTDKTKPLESFRGSPAVLFDLDEVEKLKTEEQAGVYSS